MLFKRGDSKDIIKAINKECFSNDLNTNNVIKFLNDEIPFCELKTNEKIAIIKGFYSTTRLSKFNYNKLFTYEELKQYEDISYQSRKFQSLPRKDIQPIRRAFKNMLLPSKKQTKSEKFQTAL